MTTLDLLPPDIILRIVSHVGQLRDGSMMFGFILQCALINKRFNTIVTPFLWKGVAIFDQDFLTDFLSGILTSASYNNYNCYSLGHHVRELFLDGFDLTDATLALLTIHLPNLETLSIIRGSNITDTNFKHIPRHCPKLKSLRLTDAKITEKSIQALTEHCGDHILELEVLECDRIGINILDLLAPCPLEKLTLSITYYRDDGGGGGGGGSSSEFGCRLYSNTKDDDDDDARINKYGPVDDAAYKLATFDHLTHLTLNDYTRCFRHDFITTINKCTKENNCVALPHLTELFIELLCDDDKVGLDIDNNDVVEFIKTHRGLKELTLNPTHCCGDPVLEAASTFLPQLQHLDVGSGLYSSQGVRQLVAGCPLLECLNVSNPDEIKGSAFPELEQRPRVKPFWMWCDDDDDYDIDIFFEDDIKTIRRASIKMDDNGGNNNDMDTSSTGIIKPPSTSTTSDNNAASNSTSNNKIRGISSDNQPSDSISDNNISTSTSENKPRGSKTNGSSNNNKSSDSNSDNKASGSISTSENKIRRNRGDKKPLGSISDNKIKGDTGENKIQGSISDNKTCIQTSKNKPSGSSMSDNKTSDSKTNGSISISKNNSSNIIDSVTSGSGSSLSEYTTITTMQPLLLVTPQIILPTVKIISMTPIQPRKRRRRQQQQQKTPSVGKPRQL